MVVKDSEQRSKYIFKAETCIHAPLAATCTHVHAFVAQRKDYTELTKLLPPKHEYVISVRLSPLQIELYEKYLSVTRSERGAGGAAQMGAGASLFSDYQALMRIWTHPWVLRLDEIRQEKKVGV